MSFRFSGRNDDDRITHTSTIATLITGNFKTNGTCERRVSYNSDSSGKARSSGHFVLGLSINNQNLNRRRHRHGNQGS